MNYLQTFPGAPVINHGTPTPFPLDANVAQNDIFAQGLLYRPPNSVGSYAGKVFQQTPTMYIQDAGLKIPREYVVDTYDLSRQPKNHIRSLAQV